MRKLLVTFLIIAIGLFGLLVPAVSHAQTPTIDPASISNLPSNYSGMYNSNGMFIPSSVNSSGSVSFNGSTQPQSSGVISTSNAGTSIGVSVSASTDDNSCGITSITDCAYKLVDLIGNSILAIASWILWAAGTIFNLSIVFFVVNMKSRIDSIGAIYVVWQTVRDLANMFFIFILLVIAIQTILGNEKSKKTLINVILVALFINFSYFATGLLIDASNIVALQFYKGFAPGNGPDGGTSQIIVSALKLGSIYTPGSMTNKSGSSNGVGLSSSQGIGTYLVTIIGGAILMIITAGVFLASTIFLIYRFIELLFLLMFSPLAFATWSLPALRKYGWNEWWEKLINQLIFAPVYFMFLWVVMRIITSGALQSTNTFTEGFQGDANALFGLISSFVIVILLLVYSLALAKRLGASGIDVATSVSKGFQGVVGRNTVGRASSRIANSQIMQKAVTTFPGAGRLVQKGFDYGAKTSFGDKKGGFDQAEKDAIKDKEATAKRLGPSILMTENTKKAREDAINNENTQRQAIDAKYADEEKTIQAMEEKAMDPKTSTAESIKLADDIALRKKALADKKNAEMKPHQDRSEAAKKEADRMLGVDKDEATKRVKTTNPTLKGEDFDKEVKKIMDANKGLAKEQQEKFAKSNEINYATTITKLPGSIGNITGEVVGAVNPNLGLKISSAGDKITNSKIMKAGAYIVGGTLNRATNRTSRIAESAAIRKNVIKGKSDADKFYEAAKKEIEEAAKSEPKGSGSDKKEVEEDKQKS